MSVSSRRIRREALCAECQTHQLWRVDGRVGKHRSRQTNARCAGSESVPLPAAGPVSALDVSALDRWEFLSMPFRHLQVATRAEVREVAAPDLGFMGEIKAARNPAVRWRLVMPIGQDPLERDMVARGLLAAAHGVDVSDWPVPMRFAGGPRC